MRSLLLLVMLGCLTSLCGAQVGHGEAAEDTSQSVPAEAEIQEYLGHYLDAFNKGDAKAVAALWSEDAVWRGDTAGEPTVGRDAVAASLAAAFEATPGLKLTGHIDRFHTLAPDVLTIDGTTTTSSPGEEPSTSSFTAILKKTDEGWRLCDVHEYAPPAALSPRDKLEELAFLVGEWRDESEGASVSTTVRWGAGESFLVRSYVVTGDDGEPVLQGTQVIGWDPRAEKFRSWSFDSEGGFGDGVWSHAGDEWVGRLTETLPDGAQASATQVIRLIDANTLEVSIIGREVAGEPQPSSEPVRVTRVVAADKEDASGE